MEWWTENWLMNELNWMNWIELNEEADDGKWRETKIRLKEETNHKINGWIKIIKSMKKSLNAYNH